MPTLQEYTDSAAASAESAAASATVVQVVADDLETSMYGIIDLALDEAMSNIRRGFSFQIVGSAPTADEVLLAWTPPSGEIVTFAANFANCVGKKISGGVNPASSYVLTVKKNSSTVGTITISTEGVVTFATSGGATVALTGGTDTMSIVGATSTDAAVGYTFTMQGDIS